MLRERTSAWCRAHGVSASEVRDVYFCRGALNLLDPKAVTDFLDMVAGVELRLIVFDTLARCMPGADENSARDMGLVIDSLLRIGTMRPSTARKSAGRPRSGVPPT
jgi:hypothetical protein